MRHRQLVVIGSGPGGVEAALQGAALGVTTSLVVGEGVGGNAVLHSLVPSKVMIAIATARRNAVVIGARVDPLDWSALAHRVAEEQQLEQDRAEHELREGSVELVPGQARVRRAGHGFVVEIEPGEGETASTIGADSVVGATGSVAVLPSGLAPDGKRVLLPRHLPGMTPPPMPLAVLGAGVAGVEFATAMVHLGLEIFLVANGDQILPSFSASAAKVVESAFCAEGGVVVKGFHVEDVTPSGDGVVVSSSDGRRLEAAAVLVNLGRRPLLEPFAGVGRKGSGWSAHPPGFTLCGDAIGAGVMTQGSAQRSGRAAARAALGAPPGDWDPAAEPRVAFSLPPVAAFGPIPEDSRIGGDGAERREVAFDELLSCRLEGWGAGHATALLDAAGALVAFEAVGDGAAILVGWATLLQRSGLGLDRIGDLGIPTPTVLEVFERLSR